MTDKKLYLTNKAVALNWLRSDYVMCNDLPQIDEELFDEIKYSSLGREKNIVCPECGSDDIQHYGDGSFCCNDCDHEWESDDYESEYPDFYQFFITDMTEDDVDYMCEHFSDLAFAYSPKLDCWVWCATDLGTNRSYVMVETDLEMAARKEGEPRDLPPTDYYANGIFNYIRFDWGKNEFKEVFPDESQEYLWEKYQHFVEMDKDKAFPQFYYALDTENQKKLIQRINQKRYLR